MSTLLVLLVVIVSFGVYPLMLFGPAFMIGRLRGMRWGVGTFALTLMWLMMYIVILVGFMFMINSSNNY